MLSSAFTFTLALWIGSCLVTDMAAQNANPNEADLVKKFVGDVEAHENITDTLTDTVFNKVRPAVSDFLKGVGNRTSRLRDTILAALPKYPVDTLVSGLKAEAGRFKNMWNRFSSGG